ncbi:Gfo/Idh/MocA family oxidoreductase [Terribacillus saccharophilus]|uniref:Gfo/Idh/MocA family oxidoreductase n=1 Tax=Terribacillus saccharophilus TaxID=361277 RepID=UPI002DC1D73D|nr:Gfo/Idh/MocA family oxidoreductase [Terribacillus saccharophilus]MEC0290773.1 Gfo/Idh/MocA family oxidoreductase [Terribacillus saccharophilus]
MLTIAFIGFGNSVVNYHLPYIERRSNIRVKSIFRREEDRIGDTDRENWYPSIHFTTTLQDVLQDSEIDLIVVSTHVDSHAHYAKLALKAGKHVLVEKPFTSLVEETEEIFAIAKEKNLIAMSNQNRRYDGDFLTLKKIIESGVLGNIIEIQSHYNYFRPDSITPGFGLLHGLAVHTIDQIISLFGEPESTHYDVRSIYYPGESDDYIDIDFRYGMLKATVKCSLSVKIDHPKFIVHGDKGSFLKYSSGHQKKNPHGPTVVSFDQEEESNWGTLIYEDENGKEYHESVPSEVTDYAMLYEDLYKAILDASEKPVKDEEVITVMRIMENGIAAAKKNIKYNSKQRWMK